MTERLTAKELASLRSWEPDATVPEDWDCDSTHTIPTDQFRKLVAAAEENAKLRDALETLVDFQNGPPLLKKHCLDGWNEAMRVAHELLERSPWEYQDK